MYGLHRPLFVIVASPFALFVTVSWRACNEWAMLGHSHAPSWPVDHPRQMMYHSTVSTAVVAWASLSDHPDLGVIDAVRHGVFPLGSSR